MLGYIGNALRTPTNDTGISLVLDRSLSDVRRRQRPSHRQHGSYGSRRRYHPEIHQERQSTMVEQAQPAAVVSAPRALLSLH